MIKEKLTMEGSFLYFPSVSGLLGPPGSGVEWARYLVEQMTGIYTGSINEDFPEHFAGEGKSNEVK